MLVIVIPVVEQHSSRLMKTYQMPVFFITSHEKNFTLIKECKCIHLFHNSLAVRHICVLLDIFDFLCMLLHFSWIQ